jgi:PhzF family phenazine biosynthesis protein
VAVVLDGAGLSDAQMQRFAAWTNLSETTFVLPPTQPQADYALRIFTPGSELPFAGHPTLGSCHAWLQAGGKPQAADTVVQQCAIGLVTLRRQGGRMAFAAPAMQRSAIPPTLLAQIARALGLQAPQIQAAQLLDNGPQWYGLLLDSPQTVLALTPDHLALKALGTKVGVCHLDPADTASSMQVRAFAAPAGIAEDPVTGSLNAALAQWLMADGLAPARYVACQGGALGRDGRVHIERDASGQIWVGGDCVSCVQGTVSL